MSDELTRLSQSIEVVLRHGQDKPFVVGRLHLLCQEDLICQEDLTNSLPKLILAPGWEQSLRPAPTQLQT